MPTVDTKIDNLIINKLTKAQYNSITSPSNTELYFIVDESPNQGSSTQPVYLENGDIKTGEKMFPIYYENLDFSSTSPKVGAYPLGNTNAGKTNPVTNTTEYGSVLSLPGYDENNYPYGAQMIISSAASAPNGVHAYIRRETSSPSWSNWSTILDNNNYNTYALPKAGGSLTGRVDFNGYTNATRYSDSYTGYALNLNNSNIVGVNSIYTSDASENSQEGIHFYRDITHVDTFYMKAGVPYFVPNRELGQQGTSEYMARFGSAPTTNLLVMTDGTTGKLKTATLADVGISGAMHFKGTTTTALTDGTTTAAVTIGGSSYTPSSGDVVLYNNKEFVWTGSLWEILGDESSYKVKQTAVSDPTASGNGLTYIATLSQDANGNITATKSTVQSASTSQSGVVQLNDTTSSTSTSLAATANSVKTAYDLANNHKYWANIEATSAVSYNKTPEVGSIKIGNGTASATAGKYVVLQYDATAEVLNFNFT